MSSIGTPFLWTGFAIVVTVALTLDLFVLHRRAHEMRFREAVLTSLGWILLAFAVAGWIWFEAGRDASLQFVTGWLIEEALSVDNLLVFLVLFDHFKVPSHLRHRVLFWGILGAVVTRGAFVALGVTLIHLFEWVLELFGLFLLYAGFRLVAGRGDQSDAEHSRIVTFLERRLPISAGYESDRFFVRTSAGWRGTSLFVALLAVEATDVLFAVDSVPAVFGVTRDPFLVFSSNILAVLGLRALYFVLQGLLGELEYLQHGLGLVLGFIGLEMILHRLVKVPTLISLAVVASFLAGAVATSWFARRGRMSDAVRRPESNPPESPPSPP